MILSLLNLASYTAFSVIIALSTFGLYQSYIIAIACMLSAKLSGRFDQVSEESRAHAPPLASQTHLC